MDEEPQQSVPADQTTEPGASGARQREPGWGSLTLSTAILGLAAILLVYLCLEYWGFTVDDAFISFRYGQNLAYGHGLTWNPGQPPIEGYTSFLWTVVTAIPAVLHIDVVAFAKVLGLAVTLAMLGFTYRLAILLMPGEADERKREVAATAAVAAACFPATMVHAISGMETALYACLLVAFLGTAVGYVRGESRAGAVTLAALALALGLTRPEGNLAAILGAGVVLVLTRPGRRRVLVLSLVAIYCIPGLAYFLWRFHYYGVLFPLPFYLKVASASGLPGTGSLIKLGTYLAAHFGILVLLAFGGLDWRAAAVVLIPVAALGAFFARVADIMDYAWRFAYPMVPPILALASVGLGVALDGLGGHDARQRSRTRTVRSVMLLLACGLLAISQIYSGAGADDATYADYYGRGMRAADIPLGKALAEVTHLTQHPVVALNDCGAIPYYSRWETIDTYGLNNPRIALSGKHDAQDVLAQAPSVIVIVTSDVSKLKPRFGWEEAEYHLARAKGYRIAGKLAFSDVYYLWVMAKPGTPLFDRLGALLARLPWPPWANGKGDGAASAGVPAATGGSKG